MRSRRSILASPKLFLCLFGFCSAIVLGLAVPSGAMAQPLKPVNSNTLLAKAQPDECFFGIGSSDNKYFGTPVGSGNETCAAPNVPKVNQAYVWGLTESSDKHLWFGTSANPECLVLGAYLGQNEGFQTPSYVCEFGLSNFYNTDWRPPQLWEFDTTNSTLTDHSFDALMQGNNLLTTTIGIRSAGSITTEGHDFVFLAGPDLYQDVNLFVYVDGDFKAAEKLSSDVTTDKITDIRQWVTFNGELYAGVGLYGGAGRILRWTGDATDPFQFVEVGKTPADVAYLIAHTNKDGSSQFYASTWGGFVGGVTNYNDQSTLPSGIYKSPSIPRGGQLSSNDDWTKVWEITDYEPDPVTAQTLAGGALSSFAGQVYWGLMQVPLTGWAAHYQADPSAPSQSTDQLLSIVNTTRPISVFRYNPAKNETQLLYGSSSWPVWDSSSSKWIRKPNKSNQKPVYGAAGFGNPFNTYTWASTVFDNRLYFGTFDWSYLACDGLPQMAKLFGSLTLPSFSCTNLQSLLAAAYTGSSLYKFGGDFWRFDNGRSAAKPESVDGLGNILNYGIRTLASNKDTDSSNLYVGMANPMNLKIDGTPAGGWELRKLRKLKAK